MWSVWEKENEEEQENKTSNFAVMYQSMSHKIKFIILFQ